MGANSPCPITAFSAAELLVSLGLFKECFGLSAIAMGGEVAVYCCAKPVW